MSALGKLAGDEEYAKYLLAARQRFQKGKASTFFDVKSIYNRASWSVYDDVRKLTPGTLRHSHLTALQKKLEVRAMMMNKEVLAAVHHGIWMASSAGNQGVKQIAQHMLGDALPTPAVEKIFAGINEKATLAMLARTRRDGLKISDRVWRTGEKVRNKVMQLVEDAVVRGEDARVTAKKIQQYMQPGIAKAHKAEVAKRLGISKDVSYQAMRLTRTEMNNAFYEGMVAANHSSPGYQGIYWRLSAQHVIPDICTDMANDMSYGKLGFYPKDKEPVRPHPQCMCTPIPAYENPKQFVQRLKSWRANPHSQPDLENWYTQVAKQFMPRVIVPPILPPVAPPPVAPVVPPLQPLPPHLMPQVPPVKAPKAPVLPKAPAPLAEEILDFKQLGGGVSDTWTGTVGGKKYVFKSNAAINRMNMLHGNAEGELLSSEVMRRVGLNAPKTWYKTFKPKGKKSQSFLQMEFVDDVYEIGDFGRIHHPGYVKHDQMRRMQVADVLVGNGDRHIGNFFIKHSKADFGDVIPIDHNLAFGTDRVFTPGITWQKCFVKHTSKTGEYHQSSSHIIGRSWFGKDVATSSTLSQYLDIADEVQKIFTDDVIEGMIIKLPAGLVDDVRKIELTDIFKWRRDNLKVLIEEGLTDLGVK